MPHAEKTGGPGGGNHELKFGDPGTRHSSRPMVALRKSVTVSEHPPPATGRAGLDGLLSSLVPVCGCHRWPLPQGCGTGDTDPTSTPAMGRCLAHTRSTRVLHL